MNDRDSVFDPTQMPSAEAVFSALAGGRLDGQALDRLLDDEQQQFRRMPNFWTFARQGLGVTPFCQQTVWATRLFDEWCPRCTDRQAMDELFDQQPEEVEQTIAFLEYGVCPRCGVSRAELWRTGELPAAHELAVCAGMRSGKTAATAMIALYQLHRYLTHYPTPAVFFNLLPRQTLHMLFVAVTATQAKDTLWQTFVDLFEVSPWFQQYLAFLDDQGKQTGEELYEYLPDSYLWFGHRRLAVYYSGTDIRTIRGRTRFFVAIDEIGWFDAEAQSQRVRMNAAETYHALVRALRTVRSAADKARTRGEVDPLDGISCNISSPSAANDMIMQLVRQPHPRRVAYHLPTWRVNPNITVNELREEAVDELAFERDYAAIPPLAASPFIVDDPQYTKAKRICRAESQDQVLRWTLQAEPHVWGGDGLWLTVEPQGPVAKTKSRVLTVDTGWDHNSFALTVVSLSFPQGQEQADQQRSGRPDVRALTVDVEVALEVIPHRGAKVHLARMLDRTILPLVQAFNVDMVLYDRWQSLDHIYRLRDMGVEADQLTVGWPEFVRVRERVEAGQISLPRPEMDLDEYRRQALPLDVAVKDRPVFHLLLQIFTVRQVGKKVVKPLGGTDDLWRCLVLAVGYLEQVKNPLRYVDRQTVHPGDGPAVGVLRPLSPRVTFGPAPRQTTPNTLGIFRRRGGQG